MFIVFFLPLCAALAIFVGGRRTALIWGGASVAALAVFLLLHMTDPLGIAL